MASCADEWLVIQPNDRSSVAMSVATPRRVSERGDILFALEFGMMKIKVQGSLFVGSVPMLSDLVSQEFGASLKLFNSVDAVFDTDPRIKTFRT